MLFMTPSRFNQGLDSLSFNSGIDEICLYLKDVQADDYMTGLVKEMKDANQRLFEALSVDLAKYNVQQEVKQLNDSIVAAHRFIDSCCYLPDAEVKASAKVLKKLFGSFGKPLTRMNMYTQMTEVRVLLLELSQPKMQAHVEKLPLLPERINGIKEALDTLLDKRLEVDRAESRVVKHKPLLVLKREANDKLVVLVTYLQVMSAKEPEVYGKPYAVVTEIIGRLNSTYTGGAPKASKKREDADGASGATRVAIGA
jgi:hypothetical protein